MNESLTSTLNLQSFMTLPALAVLLVVLLQSRQYMGRITFIHAIAIVAMLQLSAFCLSMLNVDWEPWVLREIERSRFVLRTVLVMMSVIYSLGFAGVRFGKFLQVFYVLLSVTIVGVVYGQPIIAGFVPAGGDSSALFPPLVAVLRRSFFGLGLILIAYSLYTGLSNEALIVRQKCRALIRALLPLVLLYIIIMLFISVDYSGILETLVRSLIPLSISAFGVVLMLEETGQWAPLVVKWSVIYRLIRHRGAINSAELNDSLESALIKSAMRRCEQNKTEAARMLGLSKSTFHRKAEKHAGGGAERQDGDRRGPADQNEQSDSITWIGDMDTLHK